jgi:hypothetical protein
MVFLNILTRVGILAFGKMILEMEEAYSIIQITMCTKANLNRVYIME